MGLLQQIEDDYKKSFKARQETQVGVLRMLKAAIKNAEIAARHELSDEEIQAVLTRAAKQHREAITLYQQGGRSDLVNKENAELQAMMLYLPTQYSDSELTTVVKEVIAEMKATKADFGKVMGAVIKKVKGQADGQRVSTIVKHLLT
jgi:hypothetical protein